jgi:hypothetical protein
MAWSFASVKRRCPWKARVGRGIAMQNYDFALAEFGHFKFTDTPDPVFPKIGFRNEANEFKLTYSVALVASDFPLLLKDSCVATIVVTSSCLLLKKKQYVGSTESKPVHHPVFAKRRLLK